MARLVLTPDGRLHAPRLLAGVVIGVALVSLTTFLGLLLAGAGDPEALGTWVLVGFFAVKVPLLAVVWWILLRRSPEQRGAGWSSEECEEILAALERGADDAEGRPDAAARLAHIAREAWYVADNATDADTPRAAATAARIEAMAALARERSTPLAE
jgi:hypothetical protein